VSGALALARSYAPERSVTETRACLVSSATDIEAVNVETYSGMLGAGLLNVPALLLCVRSPTFAPSPAPSRITFSPSLPPSWSPLLQPSSPPTAILWPTSKPNISPTLRPTLTPSLMPSAAMTATVSVSFTLSATAAPTSLQEAALRADVVAHSAPWEVQHFAVSISSARRSLQDTSNRLRGNGGSSASDVSFDSLDGSSNRSNIDSRQLSSVLWTTSFDVVTQVDSVSVAATSVMAALADPAFSSAVASSTGATVDATSISVVVLTRNPTAVPSGQPTLPMPLIEDVISSSDSASKSTLAFDSLVLIFTASGCLLVVGALIIWRMKVARSKGKDKSFHTNHNSPCNANPKNSLQSCCALHPFTKRSVPNVAVAEKSGVRNGTADDHSAKKKNKHENTIEVSSAAKFRYPGGGSFKSDDTNPEQITWALGEGGSEDYANTDQAAVEALRSRWQQRQWASHRAAHSSEPGQQPAPEPRNSPVFGTVLDTGKQWHDRKDKATENVWPGIASPGKTAQRRNTFSPTSLAASESNRSKLAPRVPKRRASYNDASDARNDFATPRGQRRIVSQGGRYRTTSGSASRLSSENPKTLRVISENNAPPKNQYRRDSRSTHAPPPNAASTSTDPWMNDDAPPSNQYHRDSRSTHAPPANAASTPTDPWMNDDAPPSSQYHRSSGVSSKQRYYDDESIDRNVGIEAFEEAASLLFRARVLKAQDNLVDASILFQRALALAERSNSSNTGLSSVQLAQAQFHLAGCLRRLSTRDIESTLSPGIPVDPKHRLNAALELYELCTTTMAQEMVVINNENEDTQQLAVDLASAYNDWGVGLWQRGDHGDAEAALSHFSRALRMRRICRGEVNYFLKGSLVSLYSRLAFSSSNIALGFINISSG